MKKLFIISLLFISTITFAQKVDTIIKTKVFTSYFCKELKEPLYVTYKLYQGGGDCSRASDVFKNDIKSLPTATAKDYAKTGYDIGHMCNAEDMAYNCDYQALTFKFYNALPQTANLNRGIWKHYETTIRNESKTDSLLIICGGIFPKDSCKTIGKNVFVPKYCFKVVQSLSTKKITYCLFFTNENIGEETNMTLDELEKLSKYNLKQYLKK